MKKIELDKSREFNPLGMHNTVLHDSEFFKVINFNIAAGKFSPSTHTTLKGS